MVTTTLAATETETCNASPIDARRYVPAGSRRIVLDLPGGEAFFSVTPRGLVQLVAYAGKAVRPAVNALCRTQQRATELCREFESRRIANAKAVATRKAEADAKNAAEFAALAVGDVLVRSWGYDQTNVDFFVVVRKTAARAYVRKCSSKLSVSGELAMSGHVVPVKEELSGDEKAFTPGNLPRRWDGKPEYCSWYG